METKINLRIEYNIKEKLDEYASQEGMHLSEYIRNIFRNHVGIKSEVSEEVYIDLPKTLIKNTFNEYEKSFDFTYLLTWLFHKYIFPLGSNNKDVIKTLKQRVERTINESSFSQELKLEFVKVLNDINRFLVESEYEKKQFYFPLKNHHLSFNYDMLMNEIWSKNH
ncbi:DUF6364 family protein [Winogradskyella helgolandensis]|uniref:DUF6364 family protein n=1 Tax=Winogradskyella helgolandensis TaxID=2697010 RepID=UPI0015CCE340|nr:DUF6364 family protein [Winogradskyella helgolandensis]